MLRDSNPIYKKKPRFQEIKLLAQHLEAKSYSQFNIGTDTSDLVTMPVGLRKNGGTLWMVTQRNTHFR